jgi:hypothetical protein
MEFRVFFSGQSVKMCKAFSSLSRCHSSDYNTSFLHQNNMFISLLLGRRGIEATTGLLYQPQMMMSAEQSAECLAGETEVLGENVSPPIAAFSSTNRT